jgi:hypothetical protein
MGAGFTVLIVVPCVFVVCVLSSTAPCQTIEINHSALKSQPKYESYQVREHRNGNLETITYLRPK